MSFPATFLACLVWLSAVSCQRCQSLSFHLPHLLPLSITNHTHTNKKKKKKELLDFKFKSAPWLRCRSLLPLASWLPGWLLIRREHPPRFGSMAGRWIDLSISTVVANCLCVNTNTPSTDFRKLKFLFFLLLLATHKQDTRFSQNEKKARYFEVKAW